MGLFDWFTGTKRPEDGVVPRSPQEVHQALLALNRTTAPFVVRDGTPEGVDLVAEWRIVDARWYEVFAKAGLTKVFKVLMRIDAHACEVRSTDQEWSVEWNFGVPSLFLTATAFRGQSKQVQFGQGYAFTEYGEYGQVYHYHFSTGELKPPLRGAVVGSGWTWRGVVFGKL